MEADLLKAANLIHHLQIWLMIIVGKQMMIMMVMIAVIHLGQRIILMNAHHQGNMMCRDMIVNKMERQFM